MSINIQYHSSGKLMQSVHEPIGIEEMIDVYKQRWDHEKQHWVSVKVPKDLSDQVRDLEKERDSLEKKVAYYRDLSDHWYRECGKRSATATKASNDLETLRRILRG